MNDLKTVKELATLYGVTSKTIRRWIGKVGQELGQALDKQGTLGYTQDECSLIAKAGGKEPIRSRVETVDAELVEQGGILTLGSGTGMRLNSSAIKRFDFDLDFDLGGASIDDCQALTGTATAELANMGVVVGNALGELAARKAFQSMEVFNANLHASMVQGAQTVISSQSRTAK